MYISQIFLYECATSPLCSVYKMPLTKFLPYLASTGVALKLACLSLFSSNACQCNIKKHSQISHVLLKAIAPGPFDSTPSNKYGRTTSNTPAYEFLWRWTLFLIHFKIWLGTLLRIQYYVSSQNKPFWCSSHASM